MGSTIADKNLRPSERIAIFKKGVSSIKNIAKMAMLPIAFFIKIVVDKTTSTPSFAKEPISGNEFPTIYFKVLKEKLSYAFVVIHLIDEKTEKTVITPPIIHR